MSDFHFSDGQLYVEEVALNAIAEEFGTPTFVYSKAAIVNAFENFQRAFIGHDHLICYSVKANSNLGILNLLAFGDFTIQLFVIHLYLLLAAQ